MPRPDLTDADQTLIDKKLRDVLAADSPDAIDEAVRQLMAILRQFDPDIPVETARPKPPGEPSLPLRKKRRR